MKRDLLFTWFFPHPPKKVWECLTIPELISQWLMKNDFKPMVGHEFQFHTKPIPKMGFDGIVYCKVLEIDPLQKLVYSWKGGAKPGHVGLDTVVIWTLQAKDDGTQLTLAHNGFDGFRNYITSIVMANGWKKNIRRRMGEVLDKLP